MRTNGALTSEDQLDGLLHFFIARHELVRLQGKGCPWLRKACCRSTSKSLTRAMGSSPAIGCAHQVDASCLLVGGLLGSMAHIDIIVDRIGQVPQPRTRGRIIPVDEADQPVLVKN